MSSETRLLYAPTGRKRFRSRLTVGALIVASFTLVNFLNHCGVGPHRVWRSLQDQVELLQLRYRADGRSQISRDYKLVFVHIPKTGGSTVEESSIFAEKERITGSRPRSHHSIRTMMNPTTIERRGLGGYRTATYIRHPCERFVSAYYYVTQDPRSKGIKPAIEKFGMMGHGKVENFLDWMEKQPERWYLLKRRIFHFFPMSSWLFHEDGTFGIDEVMCQEQSEEGVQRLFSRLNATVPNDMYRRHNQNKGHPTCAQLDQKYQARIMEEYAMDNCLFGYGDIYQKGEFTIERGHNASTCIGTHHNRTWFTQRWELCKSKLDPAIFEEMKVK